MTKTLKKLGRQTSEALADLIYLLLSREPVFRQVRHTSGGGFHFSFSHISKHPETGGPKLSPVALEHGRV